MDVSVVNGGLAPQEKQNGATQATVQRKRLLKAPTLAELDSSDSEVKKKTGFFSICQNWVLFLNLLNWSDEKWVCRLSSEFSMTAFLTHRTLKNVRSGLKKGNILLKAWMLVLSLNPEFIYFSNISICPQCICSNYAFGNAEKCVVPFWQELSLKDSVVRPASLYQMLNKEHQLCQRACSLVQMSVC